MDKHFYVSILKWWSKFYVAKKSSKSYSENKYTFGCRRMDVRYTPLTDKSVEAYDDVSVRSSHITEASPNRFPR